jgi:small subunit ribosomal protein S18
MSLHGRWRPRRGGRGEEAEARRIDVSAVLKKRRAYRRQKVCKFCLDKMVQVDFKDVKRLRNFVSDRGKIVPRRISGNCARHQRQLTVAIRRARSIALMAYAADLA